jgi:hypothetical protein
MCGLCKYVELTGLLISELCECVELTGVLFSGLCVCVCVCVCGTERYVKLWAV